MSLILIAELSPKPGAGDALRAALEEIIEPSRAEEGNLQYRPLVEVSPSSSLFLLEEWKDQAALDVHFATPHFQRFQEKAAALASAPPVIRRFSPVG